MELQIKPVHLVIVLLSYYLDYSVTADTFFKFYSLANITTSGIYALKTKTLKSFKLTII